MHVLGADVEDAVVAACGRERHRYRLLGTGEHVASRYGREGVRGLAPARLSMKACVVGSSWLMGFLRCNLTVLSPSPTIDLQMVHVMHHW